MQQKVVTWAAVAGEIPGHPKFTLLREIMYGKISALDGDSTHRETHLVRLVRQIRNTVIRKIKNTFFLP